MPALLCPAGPQRNDLLWFYTSGFELTFLYTSMYLLEINAYVLVGKPVQADFLQFPYKVSSAKKLQF